MSVAFRPFEPPASSKKPFGSPGAEPSWSPASKQGVGTAMSDESKVWFTIAGGVLTEVFYPGVDVANIKRPALSRQTQKASSTRRAWTKCLIEYIDPRPWIHSKSTALGRTP